VNTPYLHVEIEPGASDFLELLRELGHADDATLERITTELMQSAAPGRAVTLADARRVAARSLFDQLPTLRHETRELLVAEWGRLFG
jgi:hypothetical protein